MKMMIIGPQGSGKGTYASKLSAIMKIPHISTGQIFRDNIALGNALGKQVEKFVNTGALVPDEIVLEVVRKRMSEPDTKNGFIFDGFPRNTKQAEELEKLLKLDAVLYLDVPEWILLQRLSSRVTCKKCGKIYNLMSVKPKKEGKCDACEGELIVRDDEKPEAIKKRLEAYEKNTKPLVDYYTKKGILRDFKVDDPKTMPDEAVEMIVKLLGVKK
jgi:adenylate kinase